MKAAVLHAPNQPMTIEDVAIDKPKRREVLVRTAAAGLCHSDEHLVTGEVIYVCADPATQTSAPIPDTLRERIVLADGGVYDNMGLESLVDNVDLALVSDAGAPRGSTARR